MMNDRQIDIVDADLTDPRQAEEFLRLIAAYMADPMGGVPAWSDGQRSRVINELQKQPGLLVLFAKDGSEYVGVVTCFMAFSTFLAMPMLNIHDIYVEPTHRGLGIGKKLIEEVDARAKEKDCGKITLEVRKDNLSARGLYKSQGYSEAPHSMFFWTKYL
ncbi:MAG: GNAT family N-acetyltransferase [Cyclobacteriaceae bacterium]|nr:GNAT family N-acetyltransferase [Cyclobacteriaceae bacterium]